MGQKGDILYSTGLVSVSFRKQSPEQIIEWVVQAGMKGIEWGGDIHVRHGETERAREIGRLTRKAGLQVVSYGSYYQAGISEKIGFSFTTVLETALALEAPAIRVWAGNQASQDLSENGWGCLLEDLHRIGGLASERGISIHLEYHSNTVTDTNASVQRLLHEITSPNVYFYWQPRVNESVEENLNGLRLVFPRLSHLHVFHICRDGGQTVRYPLIDGRAAWHNYLSSLPPQSGRFLLLEFVQGDSPACFLRDAATLNEWAELYTVQQNCQPDGKPIPAGPTDLRIPQLT